MEQGRVMKNLFVIAFLLMSGVVSAEVTTNKAPVDKLKVLILNLNNQSDVNTYGSSDALKPVVFNSLYNFIGIIPSLDIPQQTELQQIQWNSTNIAQIAKARGADLVIYGDYSFSGPAYDPKARLNLKIYSTERVVDILSRSYNTPTDLEIFDTIDRMINDLSTELLKGKVEVAYLNFTDFKVGDEKYDIYVNDKIIAAITNDYFELNLKILAKTSYGVEIIRRFDKKTVHDSSFVLQPGVTARISHKAIASLDLKELKGKKKGSAYTFLLNNEAIQDNQLYTNLQGGQQYEFAVIEDGTNKAYNTSFYLHDGGRITLKPRIKGGGSPFGLMLNINDESFIQPALQWHISPKLWLAGGAGVSFIPISLFGGSDPSNQIKNPLFVNTYLGLGYYILGDRDTDFRLGADLSLHYSLISETGMDNIFTGINTHPLSAGAFISAEWRFIYLKVGTYYDISNNRFYYLNMGYPNLILGFKFPFGGSSRAPKTKKDKSEKSSGNLKWGLQLGINDESMLQAGIRLETSPKWWMSLGTGVSLWPTSMINNSTGLGVTEPVFFLNPYFALGYHILGDNTKDFRLGLELALRFVAIDNIPPEIRAQMGPAPSTNPLSAGAFVHAEWKFIYLKTGYYFDLINDIKLPVKYPVISAGVVLRF